MYDNTKVVHYYVCFHYVPTLKHQISNINAVKDCLKDYFYKSRVNIFNPFLPRSADMGYRPEMPECAVLDSGPEVP